MVCYLVNSKGEQCDQILCTVTTFGWRGGGRPHFSAGMFFTTLSVSKILWRWV